MTKSACDKAPSMHLIEAINEPARSGKASEDALGYDLDNNMAWVIDGASDDYIEMLRHKDTHERLDAYWAANKLSALFAEHAIDGTQDPRAYFRNILTKFTSIFEQAAGQACADIPREKHPIAAFAWIHYDQENDKLTTAGLCDSMVFAQLKNGDIITNTPTSDGADEKKRDEQWAKETGTNKLDRNTGPVHDHLIAARRQKNDFKNGGTAVLGPEPKAADHICIEEFDLGGIDVEYIMVTSDGMLRLVDTFQDCEDNNDLMRGVLDTSLAYMIRDVLRPLEVQNAVDANIPIVKAHDDAAAGLFKMQPN